MKSEINIQFEIEVVEEGDIYTCHIPFYDIHYDAKTKDEIILLSGNFGETEI